MTKTIQDYPTMKLEALSMMKATYKSMLDHITTEIRMKRMNPLTIEDVCSLRDKLVNLKHNGPTFQKILNAAQRSRVLTLEQYEQPELKFDHSSADKWLSN